MKTHEARGRWSCIEESVKKSHVRVTVSRLLQVLRYFLQRLKVHLLLWNPVTGKGQIRFPDSLVSLSLTVVPSGLKVAEKETHAMSKVEP